MSFQYRVKAIFALDIYMYILSVIILKIEFLISCQGGRKIIKFGRKLSFLYTACLSLNFGISTFEFWDINIK